MVCGGTRLDGELVRALTFLKSRILHGPPIQIKAALGEVIDIFTDGAFEPESEHSGTIGGVLDLEAGVRLGFFSEIVPPALMDAYLTVSKKPIYLVELLAVLVAAVLWRAEDPFGYVVNYIDNEASRSALTKAWSHVKFANNILGKFVDLEMTSSWKPWFSRVPTYSNPSADPSRLKVSELTNSGVKRRFCSWQVLLPELVGDAHVWEVGVAAGVVAGQPKQVDESGRLDVTSFAQTNQKDQKVRVNLPEVSFLCRSFEVFSQTRRRIAI